MWNMMSLTGILLICSPFLLTGFISGEMFAFDPDQSVLDLFSSYVKLSTSAVSRIHCGVLCLTKLNTCSYFLYDVTTTTCYGRPNSLVVYNGTSNLRSVATWSKMVDITNREKEFRSCVLERSGILVGKSTCIHMSSTPIKGSDAENYCKTTPFSGHLFEPRSEALSENYKLPMLERGFIDDNLPHWIGLHYNTSSSVYYWLTDGIEASYTDWCTANCASSPPQPDFPESQWCMVTVLLQSHGTFGWWDKHCESTFTAICENLPIL